MIEQNRDKKRNIGLRIVGIGLVLIAIVILVWLFTREEVTISGTTQDNDNNVLLTCERKGETYPFYTFARYDTADTKIDMIFGADTLRTIGLKQDLYYQNEPDANMSNANNHAAMNFKFSDDEMPADSLGAAYTVSGNRFGMSLFADVSKLSNNKVVKYFLLEKYLSEWTPSDYMSYYKNRGFICTKTE